MLTREEEMAKERLDVSGHLLCIHFSSLVVQPGKIKYSRYGYTGYIYFQSVFVSLPLHSTPPQVLA